MKIEIYERKGKPVVGGWDQGLGKAVKGNEKPVIEINP